MRADVERLIESMLQGDGHVVVDVPGLAKAGAGVARRADELVAILFVLGEEMYEFGVSSAEASRLVDAGARMTRQAARSLQP